MARGIDRTELLELLAETVNNENPMLHRFLNHGKRCEEALIAILIVDALYEKVRVDSVVQSTAVMVVCGINAEGKREVVGIELMPEESKDAYLSLFNSLKVRGLDKTALIISDAHKGLVSAIAEGFPGTLWQRCKVHFMGRAYLDLSSLQKYVR